MSCAANVFQTQFITIKCTGIMPTLRQPSSLWTNCRNLSNDEVEGLIIEGRHLNELLQTELRLREEAQVDLTLGNEVQRKAAEIRKNGLNAHDRELIAEAGHPGIAVIRDGLASAKEGLARWDHIAYCELIWLVSNTTTAAHALLLVISLGRQRLEKINLRQKSMLVSFIKQHESALVCACLESAARSLLTDQATLMPFLSSSAGLCDLQDLDRLDISIDVTTNGMLSPEHDPSPGARTGNLETSNYSAPTSQDTPRTNLTCTQLIPQFSKCEDTDVSEAHTVSVRYTSVPDPERPVALTNSCMGRVEIVLKQVQTYTEEWSSCSTSLSGSTIPSPGQEKEAFDFLRTMQDKLIYAVGIMVQKPSPRAWELINEGCQMMDGVLLQQSRSIIRLLLRIFGGEGWDRFPELRDAILRHFASVSEARLGRCHPLSVILSHLQDEGVLQGASEQVFLVLKDKLDKALDPADDEVRFLKVDLCLLLREQRKYNAAKRYGLHFVAEAERKHGHCHAATRGFLLKVGDIYLHQKLHNQAIHIFTDVLSRTYSMLGVDIDIVGVYAHRNLGWIYEELNDKVTSEYHWKVVVGAALRMWGARAEKFAYFAAEARESLRRQDFDEEVWMTSCLERNSVSRAT
ncbi:hypothetical protein HD806DRAFT_487751 [Xylariaceae sp. AK1471]|nr:hypothetical protein HD806DRAFT_487751 [Xylariaceae sp. AK1471]